MIWWVDHETGIAGTAFQQVIPPGDGPSMEFLEKLDQAVIGTYAPVHPEAAWDEGN